MRSRKDVRVMGATSDAGRRRRLLPRSAVYSTGPHGECPRHRSHGITRNKAVGQPRMTQSHTEPNQSSATDDTASHGIKAILSHGLDGITRNKAVVSHGLHGI